MLRAIGTSLLSAALVAGLASATLAGTDEYQGDTTIYSGLPTTMTRPNVLIIVDNSRATLNTAPGFPYDPYTTYPGGTDCAAGVSNPRLSCYLPWYIYTIDNQGDVANQHVLANSTSDLENLKRPTDVETPTSAQTSSTCNGSDDVIRKTLQLRGTYSGSGTVTFPNINGNTGACDTSPKGAVYVLGNYLNYTRSTTATTYAEGTPEICKVPDPIVKQSVVVEYCTLGNRALADCPKDKIASLTQTGYYQVTKTHVADASNKPGTGSEWRDYWVERVVADAATPDWASGQEYRVTADVVVASSTGEPKTCSAWISTITASQKNQREIMYDALQEAVGSSLGAVNFGAMVYGGNNSGGNLIFHMADLSRDGDVVKPLAPDCSQSANVSLPFCQFLAALPGSGQSGTSPLGKPNNIAPIASNTIRPQAESVFDAGYYFGAFNTGASVTNVLRIPDAIKNECGLNHIILLTNGLTNGDGSPKLSIVGDADGDGYPDESVYGLGSHWLDDVAKYLNVHYGITTHTVLAFQERDVLVENAAKDGRGKFFNVYSAEELSAALLKLLASIINEGSTSFVAPVVPASTTNRTVSSNKVYLGLFRPQTEGPWHGNVKKYSIGMGNQLIAADGQPATDMYGNFDRDSISYWSLRSDGLISSAEGDINPANSDPNKPKGDGGQVDAGGTGGKLLKKVELFAAAVRNEGWEQTSVPWRNIYTYLTPENSDVSSANQFLTAGQNRFVTGNVSNLAALEADNPEALIRFIHGLDYDELGLPSNATARRWVMGDVLHSRPLVFNYSKYSDIHENLCSPGDDNRYNSSIIFVGANDGMLHAFRDCDGSELWAFIPPENLSSLKNIKDPLSDGGHPTYVDGAPSAFVHDANGDGLIDPDHDKVVLIFGLRRGGGSNDPADREQGAYYALDVTIPDQPAFLWRTGFDAGDERDEFAQTWSQPRQAKIKIDDNHFKVVMFVGAGYDTNEDTRYGNTQQFLCNNATPQASRPQVCADTNTAPPGGTVDGTGTPQTSEGSVSADDRLAARGRGIYAIEVADMVREAPSTQFIPSVDGTGAGSIYWSYRYAG
jgi:type IV pilus assembly protein PilY1